jgi:hypothetical protein
MEKIEYFFITCGVVLALFIVFLFNKVKLAILNIFGGSIDKTEFAGLLFSGFLAYMLWKEANRTHEWSLFNELYIFVVAGAALTGLGLPSILNTIKDIKLGKKGEENGTQEQQ